MRDGEPCRHRGCLNHITHPCEGCGRIGGQRTIESALEAYDYGFAVTFDGDKHKVLFGTQCNVCGDRFEGETIDIYCKKCFVL